MLRFTTLARDIREAVWQVLGIDSDIKAIQESCNVHCSYLTFDIGVLTVYYYLASKLFVVDGKKHSQAYHSLCSCLAEYKDMVEQDEFLEV